ncbi:nucleolar protein 9 [Nephila pilipes]|uniref:Nucleolar protein 9 n=1 Tax=Nephila pilipes TaxID=299642 RepID=A0A8X6P522_NEPPI|nr:nucleolar protein 9 [Nephila pilipes]
MASLLNPRFKNLHFQDKALLSTWIKKLNNKIREEDESSDSDGAKTLLDNRSMIHLCSSKLAKRLQLQKENVNLSVSCLSGLSTTVKSATLLVSSKSCICSVKTNLKLLECTAVVAFFLNRFIDMMEDQKHFYEDRKGRFNFKKGKRKFETECDDFEQIVDRTPVKQRKTYRGKPHPHEGKNRVSSNVKDTENYSYSSEKHRNMRYSDNKTDASQNHGNMRYYNKKSYSSNKIRDNAFQHDKHKNTIAFDKEEKDENLSELMLYYEKILKTFKDSVSNEDAEIFVSNVLRESKGYEVKLSAQNLSRGIELLLSYNKDPAVFRQFMDAFALEKEEVCTNAAISHITQLLLNIALQNIQNWSSALESAEDNPDKENVSYFMSWISDFGEFIIKNFESCLQNPYACHVACSEIRALGGDTSSYTDFTSKNSVNQKKHFRNEYLGEESSKTDQYSVPVVLEDVPKLFTSLLKKIYKAFLNIEDIMVYVTNSSSAVVIETLLCILKKRLPKGCKRFISSFATKMFSDRSHNNIPKPFLHRNCSFVVEKMFAAADEELQLSLWNDYIADSLESLVTHSIGNYIIQRLFDVVESKEQFELMNQKIGSMFEIVRNSGHYGIFISIAGACNRLKVQQNQFMKFIMQCHQCADPVEKQIQLVPCLLDFKVCNQPEISICIQGSLLVQAILKFQKPIKVVNSILNMKPQDLAFLASHVHGCHVLNAFFGSNSVGEKSKGQLIQSLKPCIIDIASDYNGSLTLARIWMLLSQKQKEVMANILAQVEERVNANRNGSVLLKKFKIFLFKKNVEKWREIQKDFSCTNTKKKS